VLTLSQGGFLTSFSFYPYLKVDFLTTFVSIQTCFDIITKKLSKKVQNFKNRLKIRSG
jgi:hypothetical protein